MKQLLITVVKYLLAFSVAIVLLWWSLSSLSPRDMADIRQALTDANWVMVIPVFGLLLLSHLFRALRWQLLIVPLGYQPRALHLFLGVLVGYIANQLVPRAGEIARCTSISKPTATPAEKLVGTVVAERAFDLVSLVVITGFTVFTEYEQIRPYAAEIGQAIVQGLHNLVTGAWWKPLVFIAVVGAIVALVRRFRTHTWAGFLKRMARGLWTGLTSIGRLRHKSLFLVYTLAMWACYILSTWIGCWALDATASLGLNVALAMLVFGTFGIIVAPGGLGAYPVAIQKTLVLYGLSETIGLASGWLLWIAQFVFVLVAGTAAWLVLRNLKQRRPA